MFNPVILPTTKVISWIATAGFTIVAVEVVKPFDWNSVVDKAFGIVSLFLNGVIAIYMVRVNSAAKETKENSDRTKVATDAAAVSMEKIHVAVNSERAAMVEKMQQMTNEIRRISEENAKVTAEKAALITAESVKAATQTKI